MAHDRSKELAVNTGLFAISSFGSRLISFLLLPLYTSVLSTGDYGTVDLMYSTVSLLVPLLTLNIQDAVLRFGLSKDSEPEAILAVGLRMVAAGSCALAVVLLSMILLDLSPVDSVYAAFLFAMFVLTGLTNVITMYVKSQDQVRSLVVSGLGNTLLMSVSAVILLVVVRVGVIGYMASMVLGNLFAVTYLSIAGKVWQSAMAKVQKGLFCSMITFSAPLVANSLAWWVNDVSDRWVIAFVCGAAANGIYAVAYKIPTILSTLQTVFYNAWAISAVKEFDPEDSDGFLGKMYELYSGAMSVCCSCIMLLNVPLATFLYSNDFFEAWRYVPLLLVATLLYGLALFEGCLFTAARDTRAVSSTTLAGAATSIVSCVVLSIAIGPMGAVVATLLGYLMTWVTRTRVMLVRIAAIRVNWRTEIITLIVLATQAVLAMRDGFQPLQIIAVLLVFFLRRGQLRGICNFAIGKMARKRL